MSQYPTGPAGPTGPTDAYEPPPPLPPAGQQPPYVPQYLPYSSSTILPYESARPRARVVVGLLWTIIVIQLGLIWPYLDSIADLDAARKGEWFDEEVGAADIALFAGSLLYLTLYITMVVFWMMWVHRTYRNLRSLGADGLTFSPGWAVGYNFIPIMNLFRPYQVMRETWRASDPRHAGGANWLAMTAPALIGVWWAMQLLSNFASSASMQVGMRSEDADVLYSFAWVDLFLLVFDIALALIEIHLVRSLTNLQEARASTYVPADPYYAAGGYPPGYYADPAWGQPAQQAYYGTGAEAAPAPRAE